ncbi:Rieske 2Fe-2S domain-containing protein [Pseudomaricurvus alkylphenolicus]|jgi:phenylpropionate dioxygenase-like ring-hydroxylating dioxygenase large terminal subunit|uniref:Rieske 2Fe-2S domain-containing protein n=1 Tax=Pseudomaricurvus alkylphenolicus TaxID=1306991 RepID=UPI00141E721B|nr:Rieske 2Fe-2S domain-containing protein [Pseudomaricurvus alkylphenolicus]NIB42121.1 Rieske 2Fe-2S domain-containing protein [Pseudomaricurvus alkylphenolicus]
MKKHANPYPFGWFKIAYSKDLEVGQVKPIHYFGRELVLFRTESGSPRVLDAYCPHLGAHLGYSNHEHTGRPGPVVGDSIVCPFHGWQFNGAGECTHIPYAKRKPPRACDQAVINAWSVEEKNQCIWLWFHPENEKPMFEVVDIPEAAPGNEEWSDFEIHEWELKANIQDVAENGADPAHFYYVHGTAEMPSSDTEVEFNGHQRRSVIRSRMKTPKGVIDGQIEAVGNGPGQSYTRFSGICETVLVGGLVPIDEERLKISFSFLKKRVNGEVPEGGVSQAIIRDICKQLEEDSVIWEHKTYHERPLLCDGDGPIAKLRKWFGQFYQVA